MANRTWFTNLTLTPTEAERFWSKVERSDGCWTWRGPIGGSGYGTFALRGTSSGAHRVAYLAITGDIADGLVLDHLCRNRPCVNPGHLEPVTPHVNSLRSPLVTPTHCSKGHELTPDNVGLYAAHTVSGTTRSCLICSRRRAREGMQRHRDKVKAAKSQGVSA